MDLIRHIEAIKIEGEVLYLTLVNDKPFVFDGNLADLFLEVTMDNYAFSTRAWQWCGMYEEVMETFTDDLIKDIPKKAWNQEVFRVFNANKGSL